MEAREQAFYFMQATMCVEVPFFQRGYVWDEENWEELIDNLIDDNQSHYLGSIILKQQPVPSGEVPRCYVIDGQQRLTTLSIILRACYDSLPLATYSDDVKNSTKARLNQILFFKEENLSDKQEIKIQHSLVDAPDYRKIVTGEMKDQLDTIIVKTDMKKKLVEASNILRCYRYFMDYFKNEPKNCKKLWELLNKENFKTLVKIDLGVEENEQAIFDTINSAGVRLTCFDTIKNALFQKMIENGNIDKSNDRNQNKNQVIDVYNRYWNTIFSSSEEEIKFWEEERQLGRMVRSNQEILLHCVALIKDIYNPEKHKMSELSKVYKDKIKDYNNQMLLDLIKEINEYAKIYRDNFVMIDKTIPFVYSKDDGEECVKRFFHVLNTCEVSTLHPYILKLFKDYNVKSGVDYSKAFLDKLQQIESYVIRHYICQASTKNFNKDCALLINGTTDIDTLRNNKGEDIDDDKVNTCLKSISNTRNKMASLILFWIELRRRENDNKFDLKELKYTYSLEHIMPQQWEEYWDITSVPVVDIATNKIISDPKKAKEIRASAIYEIGNMTLINSSLNASLRNFEFSRKINGVNRKKGLKDYASLDVAREVVKIEESLHEWNEGIIRQRTVTLMNEFFKIWK